MKTILLGSACILGLGLALWGSDVVAPTPAEAMDCGKIRATYQKLCQAGANSGNFTGAEQFYAQFADTCLRHVRTCHPIR